MGTGLWSASGNTRESERVMGNVFAFGGTNGVGKVPVRDAIAEKHQVAVSLVASVRVELDRLENSLRRDSVRLAAGESAGSLCTSSSADLDMACNRLGRYLDYITALGEVAFANEGGAL